MESPNDRFKILLKVANIYTFYINIHSDNIEDAMEIKTSSDLVVGDVFDFAYHELEELVRSEFESTLFIIAKRTYNLKYKEMHLELIPY